MARAACARDIRHRSPGTAPASRWTNGLGIPPLADPGQSERKPVPRQRAGFRSKFDRPRSQIRGAGKQFFRRRAVEKNGLGGPFGDVRGVCSFGCLQGLPTEFCKLSIVPGCKEKQPHPKWSILFFIKLRIVHEPLLDLEGRPPLVRFSRETRTGPRASLGRGPFLASAGIRRDLAGRLPPAHRARAVLI